MALWLLIAQHELFVALKTRRALVVSGLYVGAAIISAVLFALTLRELESAALDALSEQGLDPVSAGGAFSLSSESAYAQIASWFAGVPIEEVAESFRKALVVPVFFWASLAFTPYLIAITSYDFVVSETANRSIRYSTLRASRPALLAGKLAAHGLILALVTAIAAAAFAVCALTFLQSTSAVDLALGLGRAWLTLLPYVALYLTLTAIASVLARRSKQALALALTATITLRIFGWFGAISESSSYAPLRFLEYLSPSRYHAHLWRSSIVEPLVVCLAYSAVAIAFALGATMILKRKDL